MRTPKNLPKPDAMPNAAGAGAIAPPEPNIPPSPLDARVVLPTPVFRKVRVFAVDPDVAARFDTALLNEMTLRIPFERLKPGPEGEYVRVVDEDENGRRIHEPLNLDRLDLLAQDGLPVSDGNPAFRQQMVYAVIMRTIGNFERALGRSIHWPPIERPGGALEYRQVLDVLPHYNNLQNAFFDPARGFCFGYFEADEQSTSPGTVVFTALSQDVIAHELTHALLWGLNIKVDDNARDEHAFHEAFADLVALFQHFWPSDVLRAQIAAVRGNLSRQSALGAVALQFGRALGMPDGLRNALGKTDVNGVWQPRQADPKAYGSVLEPHERGDILVGAVFDAFNKIYESRVEDLRRLATRGSGILPEGTVHPDLVERFMREASCAADVVLAMCIRALDYLPPFDLSFGDLLRAIITADHDLAPADGRRNRVALLDAFRRHGIFPRDVGTLSVETLLWPSPVADRQAEMALIGTFVTGLKRSYWDLPESRKGQWELFEEWRKALEESLRKAGAAGPARLGAIEFDKPFAVTALHVRERPQGASLGTRQAQWVVRIVQQVPGRRDGKKRRPPLLHGCTLIVNADSGRVAYIIERTMTRPVHKGGGAARPKAEAYRPEAFTDPLTRAGRKAEVPPLRDRRLRVFAFDPTLGVRLDTWGINEVVLSVPWERDANGNDLVSKGPVGEYVEVVDRDPSSGCFYAPVDLNHPHVLAENGLAPSESNPQFHQQMVYAVAMRTIRHFEAALGRLALWSPRREKQPGPEGKLEWNEEFVQRLRLYPHALREANAYYSPAKKAILFGYFPAPGVDDRESLAQLTVFTCLSHDIIAHEVTHALLDGMHRRFNEPSNPDVLAFHEAFADLVALFQHFSLPNVLRHQIAASRGDLASQNQLGQLAQQFGQAVGKRGALRSAIGHVDEKTGKWTPSVPDPGAYRRQLEPHARGSILVAAVFDAFLTLYKNNVAGLLRIATEGTGVLPEGQLHPDLVNRLSDEAAGAASRMLHMCIRALDYCPPVDITFGDYLRAMLTANFEHDPEDEERRCVAVVEAFRRYGIIPDEVRTLSVDGLLWRPTSAAPNEDEDVVLGFVKDWVGDIANWNLTKSRKALYELMEKKRAALHKYLQSAFAKGVTITGVDPNIKKFEVHSIRPSIRTDVQGKRHFQWNIELTQLVPQYFDPADADSPDAEADYYFRGGSTLIVDAQSGKIRYSIRKPLTEARKERQRRYFLEEANHNLAATYFGRVASEDQEPFAMLHRFGEEVQP